MMTPVDLHFQVGVAQWSWTIAWFLWFIGIAGMCSVAYFFIRRLSLAFVIFFSLVAGLVLIVSHLPRWWNIPGIFWNMLIDGNFNFGSWMLIGVLVLTIHLVLVAIILIAGVARRLPERFALLRRTTLFSDRGLFAGFFAIVGFFSTVYSGFLLSQAVGIPLWNTALIPLLWVISSSIAAIAILDLFHVFGFVEERVVHIGGRIGLGLDVLKLLAVLAFLHVSLAVGAAAGARIGAAEMVSGGLAFMTWGGVVIFGILVPLGIGIYTLSRGKKKPLLFISSLASLTGVLLLRATILLAGAFEPLMF
jgi:protein NrfD